MKVRPAKSSEKTGASSPGPLLEGAVSNSERSSIQFGATRIDYQIRRSIRRKTVAIALEPTGEVIVTAPIHAEVSRLDALVQRRGHWILEHRRGLAALEPALPPRQFTSGESYLYLGRQYRMLVRISEVRWARIKADAGRLVVDIPKSFPEEFRTRLIRRMLTGWYRGRAKERLEALVEKWSNLLELPPAPVLIREQEKRWGSCDAEGRLRFNWRILQAPMRLVEYVVAHESVHRLHPDHTEGFWAALGRLMPDYEARREELRRLGARLEW